MNVSYGIRRRPILPGRVQPSTFGAEGLNFCVRYGNRWDPFAIATGNSSLFKALLHPDNCTVEINLRLLTLSCYTLVSVLEIKPSTY